VEITLNMDGLTRVRETSYAGVWWAEYLKTEDMLVAEYLKITNIPEIVVTERDEVERNVHRLCSCLSLHTDGRSTR